MIQEQDLKHLGQALSMLRVASGLQQKQISEVTGMSRSQVSRYKRGRDMPTVVTVTRYLQTVGADFADLQHTMMAVKGGQPRTGSIGDDAALISAFIERILKPCLRSILVDWRFDSISRT